MNPELATIISTLIASIGSIFSVVLYVRNLDRIEKINQKRISEAESLVASDPKKIKPAWDLARLTLESYFNKNLSQITSIFWLSVFVMLIGFAIIVWGITQAIATPESSLPPIITGFSGVITELIGATFIFLYQSTMKQASDYSKTLERINSVGMAMQILDTMPDDASLENLKENTKASVVRTLMKTAYDGDLGE
jgi:hypothetical protein